MIRCLLDDEFNLALQFFFSFGSKLPGSKTFQGSDCSLAQRKQGDEEMFSHLEHTAHLLRELSALLCVLW